MVVSLFRYPIWNGAPGNIGIFRARQQGAAALLEIRQDKDSKQRRQLIFIGVAADVGHQPAQRNAALQRYLLKAFPEIALQTDAGLAAIQFDATPLCKMPDHDSAPPFPVHSTSVIPKMEVSVVGFGTIVRAVYSWRVPFRREAWKAAFTATWSVAVGTHRP